MNKRTKEKYMKLLNEIATMPEFKGSEMVRKHNVASNIITAMMDTGLITKVEVGRYMWIMRREPTSNDAKLIGHALRVRRLNTDSMKVGQLTLQPIRKAPVSMPEPIVKEPEYDTSNSKMLLILAVGAMVGFMIATIIWK
jgi:hypothetical protein